MDLLVALDQSEPAQEALEYAARAHPDADVTAVHAINPIDVLQGDEGMYGGYEGHAYEELVESQREAAEELFADAREVVADRDVSLATETVVGHPAREIVSFAEERGSDHVFVGSHGRSGVSRVLLGSVAERVVRRAPVPVTVVR